MIKRPKIHSRVTSSPEPDEHYTRVGLACGHETIFLADEDVPTVGADAECHICSDDAYRLLLDARPASAALRYPTADALRAAHPGAEWHEHGPVLKYGDILRVQVYLGQHEWLAINVEDVRDVMNDPGWEGDCFGHAFVAAEHITYAYDGAPEGGLPWTEAPLRSDGKPITGDELLFADRDKLRAYLGPDDPRSPRDAAPDGVQ
jgi:hypothetical protein